MTQTLKAADRAHKKSIHHLPKKMADSSAHKNSTEAGLPLFLQSKLEVNQPGDQYEQEADQVADQIMRMSDRKTAVVQRQPLEEEEEELPMKSIGPLPDLQRQTEEEEELLQPKANATGVRQPQSGFAGKLNSRKGGGQPLPPFVRNYFEPRFKRSFDSVRVHHDQNSNQLNNAINAKAFTTGRNIFFSQGEYNPVSQDGRHLLAHELTHVIQQGGGDQYKGQAAIPTIQRRPRRREITFGDDEGSTIVGHVRPLGADVSGVSVASDVDNIVDRIKTAWNVLANNYLGGIANFRDYMGFASAAEAEANYLKASLKFAGEQLLTATVNQFANRIPGLDIVLGFVKEMVKEHDRAAGAGRQVVVRDYIVNYRTSVLAMLGRQMMALNDLEPRLLREFQQRVSSAPPEARAAELATPRASEGPDPQRVITGPGAQFLNSVSSAADGFSNSLPSADIFLQRILERWVRTREDQVESSGGGSVYMGGRIYMELKMYKDGSSWSITRPSQGRLAAPEADRTVDGLHRVMERLNISINELAIKKVLKIRVENEINWGFNDYFTIYLHYTSPDTVTYSSGWIPSPVRRATLRKARRIGPEAMSRVNLNNLRVTRLKAY